MARAKGGLHRLAYAALLQFLQTIITAATGNAYAPTPNPSLLVLQGLLDDGVTKANAVDAAVSHLGMLRTDLNDHQAEIIDALTTYIAYAESVTDRDPMKLQSLGLPLRNPASPPQPCVTVVGLLTSVGDNEQEMSATWDGQSQADGYHVQISVDPITPTSWERLDAVSVPVLHLNGLSSGQKR